MKNHMKKHIHTVYITLSISLFAGSASAGGSAEASAQALTHSLEAIAYSLEGGLKLASGAAAIPLITVGEIGKVSGEVGYELMEEAESMPHGLGAYPVTDEVITVGPNPADQLNQLD